jgi:hypothetical protein
MGVMWAVHMVRISTARELLDIFIPVSTNRAIGLHTVSAVVIFDPSKSKHDSPPPPRAGCRRFTSAIRRPRKLLTSFLLDRWLSSTTNYLRPHHIIPHGIQNHAQRTHQPSCIRHHSAQLARNADRWWTFLNMYYFRLCTPLVPTMWRRIGCAGDCTGWLCTCV